MKTYFWDGSGFKCPVCGGGSGHCGNWLTKTRVSHYARALWLTMRIMEWPWSALSDEFDYLVPPKLAWQVAKGLWLGRNVRSHL